MGRHSGKHKKGHVEHPGGEQQLTYLINKPFHSSQKCKYTSDIGKKYFSGRYTKESKLKNSKNYRKKVSIMIQKSRENISSKAYYNHYHENENHDSG